MLLGRDGALFIFCRPVPHPASITLMGIKYLPSCTVLSAPHALSNFILKQLWKYMLLIISFY